MPQPNDRPYDRLIQLKPNFSQSLSEPWRIRIYRAPFTTAISVICPVTSSVVG